ncbi:ABC transporter ATP-binding protein [Cryobacterium tagatosivorans]|uniref:ABC transporter ATP-binding protein n=1 Tax=Cryobacterium tagatosivorans TaxID=1259199 RepID=A0A4R8UES7_9MICO|nr:ABC transporter ATP-binding protein [Cryobacterium tagatosivorans]TFB51068.1 ABC transporter ATP-binding protein [Cryobacterium tagatosivorans]
MTAPTHAPVLQVDALVTTFTTPDEVVRAVDDVSFVLYPGRILGIVGESGSGKSVTARSIMRMVHAPGRVESGCIMLGDRDLRNLDERAMRSVRGRDVAMIFQDPQAALNPVIKIGDQIIESLQIHGMGAKKAKARALELLSQVGIPNPEEAFERYQHQYSGGMRQRVVIAIALANNPSVLIADEPTTALDVTIQAQILELLRKLRTDLGIAILLITHDMGVVAEMCDDVLVMYKGKVVERGPTAKVLAAPEHEYTISLMNAVPRMDSPLRAPFEPSGPPALEVSDLRTDVNAGQRSVFRRKAPFYAVDGVSIAVHPGETVALVGESGCGKSTLSRTIVGIYGSAGGTIRVGGRDVTAMTPADRRHVTRGVQYVFQDPYSSLNPRRTAGQSIEEALRVAGTPASKIRERSIELMRTVGLPAEHLDRYPYAFSGGQRQRIGIARALAGKAKVLVLDEPVSALDVSIQAEILDLLMRLQAEHGLGYLFISHDLAVVREISHRVAVMYKGKIVEQGTTQEIFEAARDPYTQRLLASTPKLDVEDRP